MPVILVASTLLSGCPGGGDGSGDKPGGTLANEVEDDVAGKSDSPDDERELDDNERDNGDTVTKCDVPGGAGWADASQAVLALDPTSIGGPPGSSIVSCEATRDDKGNTAPYLFDVVVSTLRVRVLVHDGAPVKETGVAAANRWLAGVDFPKESISPWPLVAALGKLKVLPREFWPSDMSINPPPTDRLLDYSDLLPADEVAQVISTGDGAELHLHLVGETLEGGGSGDEEPRLFRLRVVFGNDGHITSMVAEVKGGGWQEVRQYPL